MALLSKKDKIIVLISFVLLFGYGVFFVYTNHKEVQEAETSSQRGVIAWLNAFTSGNYEDCDSLISDNSYKITDFDFNSESSVLSDDIYLALYDKLSSCIVSTEVVNIKDGVYSVKVVYKPYKSITSISVDETKLKQICDEYIQDSLSKEEYESELETIYLDAFNNSFEVEDASVSTVIKLSEKEVDRVTYVYYTKEFVDSLLADTNITNILDVYENNIQIVVNKVLQQY